MMKAQNPIDFLVFSSKIIYSEALLGLVKIPRWLREVFKRAKPD